MTQTVQFDKNPSAEGAAARVSRAAATPSLATDTFTAWPPVGARSHKIVATATTVATTGLPNSDRPAAAAGEKWSTAATVRNSNTSARSISVALVFYNTIGATLGTALATTADTRTLAAGEVATFEVNGATAPAGTASVDVQVSRNAGTGAAVSDAVHVDAHTLTRTATRIAYRDPAATPFATWSGTAHASTQVYWDPVITLSPMVDPTPCPRMIVLVDDLPSGIAFLTITRAAEGRTTRVRGAVFVPVVSGFQVLDVECGFQVQSDYRAELFTADGTSVGFTPTASGVLAVDETWVHNPLDPEGATLIDLSDESGRALTRPVNGDRFYPEQRVLAIFVTGRRLGLQGVDLYFSTDQDDIASRFEAMLGGYDDENATMPILVVRTPPFTDFPRTFFAGVLSPKRKPINVHMGGSLREWELSADEAAPPFPGIIVPLLTRNDIDAAYATRNALDAAYASRLAIDRDFSKAGTT